MSDKDLLLEQLGQAYNRRSWHGTNLRGSLRGLSARDVVWRPAPSRHNIQELVVHAAYWKYTVRRRLARETRGTFPLPGSNWFARERADARQWRDDVRLLDEMHALLRTAIEDLDPSVLHQRIGSVETTVSLLSGIIAHDLYHAGQIQLLKRLRK